jgi:tRNA 5-methylaminomethyl-2-thiouridine biosynthesis bifunctional protein
MYKQLNSALEWRDGQPYSTHYEDVYFSTNPDNPQQGLEETRYVFIANNQLEARFGGLTHGHFTILETGFGTGLNFLCTCQLWLISAPKNAHLHFISTEKHPLTLQEMQQAHALWPSLRLESSTLLSQYSGLSAGSHHFHLFDNRVLVTLLIGDVNTLLPSLHAQVDAWFLDGFSPAKNPEMWQESLFAEMARLSHLHTTFATFTSAGFVRRGLQAVGFKVEKQAGFGKKREMLRGTYVGDSI